MAIIQMREDSNLKYNGNEGGKINLRHERTMWNKINKKGSRTEDANKVA